ncbi:MAG: hypothetical protein AAB276_09330 [Pseudomonadota bacterium]
MTPFKEFPNQLTLALPKQDKLNQPIIQFLERYRFKVERQGDGGMLHDTTRTIPRLRLAFVRAAEGLLLLERGVVDMAIISSDMAAELVPVFDFNIAETSATLYARPDCNFMKNLLTAEFARRFKQEPIGAPQTLCTPKMVA